MGSPPVPNWQPPNSRAGLARSYQGFQQALRQMSPSQLLELSTRQAAMIQTETAALLQSTLSTLSGYSESQDQPVLSRASTAIPSPDPNRPTDRGAPASPIRQPGALDRLAESRRLGPRLAARIVLHSARSEARRG